MDIRTKLILALVSVSLLSMVFLGLFAYKTSAILFKEVSVRQLVSLAESKRTNLLNIYDGWKTQVRLIGSRTQLREGLRDYQLDQDRKQLKNLEVILGDAASVAGDVVRISLFDKAGQPVLAVGEAAAPMTKNFTVVGEIVDRKTVDGEEVVYGGSFSASQNEILVKLLYPLKLNDTNEPNNAHVGWLEVIIDARDISSLTENYTGLGNTGEVLAVMNKDADNVAILNSVRHQSEENIWLIARDKLPQDIAAALADEEKVITADLRDYRGESVWSVTRYVPGLDWGLIVKIDEKEESERVKVLRDAMLDLALALSAFAVIGGTILGIYLARPIRDLAGVVHRLRDGNLEVKAEVKGDDEVAYLAESLNDLIEDMRALQAEKNDSNA